MQVKELGHVVLYVRDLQKSVHFYRDVLGFKQLGDNVGFPAAAFTSVSNRTHHELLLIEVGPTAQQPPRGRRTGLYHIGLKVGTTLEELKAAKAELEAEGVNIVGASDHTVTNSLYILDPDGNEIEVYIDVQPELWRDDPTLIMAPTKALRI